MRIKVISGGQNGVDQAALFAAETVGFETGGYMPKGFRTLDGNRPDIGRRFGMIEHNGWDYPSRTYDNVRMADGTLRLAYDFKSAGERCTMKAVLNMGKPCLDIKVLDLISSGIGLEEKLVVADSPTKNFVLDWIKKHGIITLNVAGNSEKTKPGIQTVVYFYLRDLFTLLKEC